MEKSSSLTERLSGARTYFAAGDAFRQSRLEIVQTFLFDWIRYKSQRQKFLPCHNVGSCGGQACIVALIGQRY
jgi:hypothetical protein